MLDEEKAQSNGPVKSTAAQSNDPVKSTAAQSNVPVKSTAVVVLMRDMLLGTLEHMDKLTGQGLGLTAPGPGPGLEVTSLLRVMLAITHRVLPMPMTASVPVPVPVPLPPHPQPLSEPLSTSPINSVSTNTCTNIPSYTPTNPPLGVGGLGHARASLLAFHRSLRVLQGQGQGLAADAATGNNNDGSYRNNNNDDADDANEKASSNHHRNNDSDDDESPPTPPAAATSIVLQLLLDILPRACTLLSSPHLSHQVLALASVRACFERLAVHSPAKVDDVLTYSSHTHPLAVKRTQ